LEIDFARDLLQLGDEHFAVVFLRLVHSLLQRGVDALLLPLGELPLPTADLDYALVVVADDLGAAGADRVLQPNDSMQLLGQLEVAVLHVRAHADVEVARVGFDYVDMHPGQFRSTPHHDGVGGYLADRLVLAYPLPAALDLVLPAMVAGEQVDMIADGRETNVLHETLDAQALVGRALASATHAEHITSSPTGHEARHRS
jgi:hypothetical protein